MKRDKDRHLEEEMREREKESKGVRQGERSEIKENRKRERIKKVKRER